jgi:hypothetical protein
MKINLLTFIILLFICAKSQAQDRKFDIGLSLMPSFSTGIISNDGTVSPTIEESVKEVETWKPSFSSTLFVEYTFNDNSIFGFGLGYQNNGERTKKLNLISGIDPLTGSPLIDPAMPSQARFVYNHHNIEIPIYYKHLFSEKIYVTIGGSGLVNITNTKTSIKYYSGGDKAKNTIPDDETDFRRFNFSGNLGFGYNYLSKEKLTLFAQPYMQYGFLGLSKSAPLNRNSFSIGILMGVKI